MSTYAVTYGFLRVDACEAPDRAQMQTGTRGDALMPAREVAQRIEPAKRPNDSLLVGLTQMNARRMHQEIDASYAQRAYLCGYFDGKDAPEDAACVTPLEHRAEYERGYAAGSLARTMAPIVAQAGAA